MKSFLKTSQVLCGQKDLLEVSATDVSKNARKFA